MEEKIIELTSEGFKKLETRLDYLKTHQRREVADRIRQAKEFGEIGENSEYEDAKKEQAFIEGEIARLEDILRTSRIIDRKEVLTSEVSLGSTVLLEDMDAGKQVEYTIVGSTESDPSDGMISHLSPVGSALFGKKKGQEVEIQVPKGKVRYKIVKILKGRH